MKAAAVRKCVERDIENRDRERGRGKACCARVRACCKNAGEER